eukprot:9280399-Karenia_brevis.AAC.1
MEVTSTGSESAQRSLDQAFAAAGRQDLPPMPDAPTYSAVDGVYASPVRPAFALPTNPFEDSVMVPADAARKRPSS